MKRIRIRVGALSLVDAEALRFALEVASRGTPAEGASIEIVEEAPSFRCRRCGHTWSIDEESLRRFAEERGLTGTLHLYPDAIVEYLSCPRCGSRDVEITRGKGVILEFVEIDTGE